MSLNGVNKLCAQCIHECKQWKQVLVINCPYFESKLKESAKPKNEGTLQAQQNRKEAPREAIFEKKGYVGVRIGS